MCDGPQVTKQLRNAFVFLSIHALVTKPNNAIANWSIRNRTIRTIFLNWICCRKRSYEIVPGQVRMTKNDITWHYTREWRIQDLPNRGGPWQARNASLYNRAHSGSSLQLGWSDPLVGITGAPLKLEASCSFYTKDGSKVKDVFKVIARPRVQDRLFLAAMNGEPPLILVYVGRPVRPCLSDLALHCITARSIFCLSLTGYYF